MWHETIILLQFAFEEGEKHSYIHVATYVPLVLCLLGVRIKSGGLRLFIPWRRGEGRGRGGIDID